MNAQANAVSTISQTDINNSYCVNTLGYVLVKRSVLKSKIKSKIISCGCHFTFQTTTRPKIP